MFDKPLIIRKLEQMDGYLEELRGIAQKSKREFVGSPLHYEAERLVELIVGNALDINFHIIKELNLRTPTQYKDSFILLGKAGILSASFARKIAQSAGLRNLLIHQYDDVDLDRFYKGLKTGIADYERYIKAVMRRLAKE